MALSRYYLSASLLAESDCCCTETSRLKLLEFSERRSNLRKAQNKVVLQQVALISDSSTLFSADLLVGLISISSRFLPTVADLLRRLAAEAHGNPAPEASMTTHHVASQSFRSQVNSPNLVSSSVSSSSNISTENDFEYMSLQLTHRRVTQMEQEESS